MKYGDITILKMTVIHWLVWQLLYKPHMCTICDRQTDR